MSRVPMHESGSAVADAAGVATVRLGPRRAFEKWVVTGMTVQSTSTVLIPAARVYAGAVADARLIDGTDTGTFDHTDTNRTLESGQDLVCQWEGCDVGSACTFVIEGEAVKP